MSDFKAMRPLPASSVFVALKIGKQGLRIEFRYQGIISFRVVEAFEPLDPGLCPTPVADYGDAGRCQASRQDQPNFVARCTVLWYM